MWYLYTTESYSAIERKKFESTVVRWMNLEPVIQSELNQKEKNKYCILTHRKSGFNPCIEKIPWRKEWLPTPVFLTGEFFTDGGAWLATVHGDPKSQT